jgi:hypothetical protein
MTFILKPGKVDYTEAMAYRPISLSSILLKTMAKLVDVHIREEVSFTLKPACLPNGRFIM